MSISDTFITDIVSPKLPFHSLWRVKLTRQSKEISPQIRSSVLPSCLCGYDINAYIVYTVATHGRIQGGGGGAKGLHPPEKSQVINTGSDPLKKNHKATEPAFNVGPSKHCLLGECSTKIWIKNTTQHPLKQK